MNATTQADVLEVWRPISGYAGLYSVSSLGRVRSEPKHVIRRNGRYRTCDGTPEQETMQTRNGTVQQLSARATQCAN